MPFLGSAPLKYLLGLPRENGFGRCSTAEQVASSWDGSGKVAVITGGCLGAPSTAPRAWSHLLHVAIMPPHHAPASCPPLPAHGQAHHTPAARARTTPLTGATSGVGLESAIVLASRGCELVLGARNPLKTEQALAALRQRVPGARVTVLELELGSLRSVKGFADAVKKTGKPVNILMCNAGIMACPFALSEGEV